MLPVSRISPENSRLLGLLFSNYLNLHIKISNFLAKSDHFEHFLKNSIFEKCFDPFCMRKNRLNWFWNFQFSGWLRRFWAIFEKFYLWKFTSVLTHFVGEEFNLRLLIFWINQNILSFFWKILILEKLLSVLTHFVWELFFNFLDESEDSKKLFYLGINLEKLFYTRDKFGKKLKIFFPNLSLGINLEKSWKYFFRIYP